MLKNILVVTPVDSFGELIRQSLSDSGSYQVFVVKGTADPILNADEVFCSLALLDMDLGENDVLEIGRSLRRTNPDIDLVIIAEQDLSPRMDSIRPWVLLRKPFYLPDFIQLINAVPIIPDNLINILDESLEEVQEDQEPEPDELPWLQDVSKAAQHLTRLTLESSAQAALITRDNDLWAYAGQLSQNAAIELASTVSRHWDGQKGNDLLRFVRLESTKAEHMLYATRMTADIILALVFDAETPFSTIRSQANRLAQSLALPGTEAVRTVERTPHLEGEQAQFESDADMDEYDEELEIPSIAEIIDEVPPPIPPPVSAETRAQLPIAETHKHETELDIEQSGSATRPSTPTPNRRVSRESSPAIPLRDLIMTDQPVNDKSERLPDLMDDLDATLPSKSRRRPSTPIRPPVPGELDETRPHSITEVAGRMILEPASHGLAQLNYACLLMPRFTSHYLTGDIADRLSEWMPKICIAFGWRLEFLAVRPEYLQWVVNVTPNASPGYLMRIMRQQTSERIFTEFPRLRRENPSGDFWAPGYLIMGGVQPHPPQLVKDYIKQTRERQGIINSRK